MGAITSGTAKGGIGQQIRSFAKHLNSRNPNVRNKRTGMNPVLFCLQ